MNVRILDNYVLQQLKRYEEGRSIKQAELWKAHHTALFAKFERVEQAENRLQDAKKSRNPISIHRAKVELEREKARYIGPLPVTLSPGENETGLRNGKEGEERVLAHLRSTLVDSWYAFVGYKSAKGEIDFVLVGPDGILAIEVKNYAGTIYCEGDSWWRPKHGSTEELGKERSPSVQINECADQLARVLSRSGIRVRVARLVVFSNAECNLGDPFRPNVDLACKLEHLNVPQICRVAASEKLTTEQIDETCSAIEKDHELGEARRLRSRGEQDCSPLFENYPNFPQNGNGGVTAEYANWFAQNAANGFSGLPPHLAQVAAERPRSQIIGVLAALTLGTFGAHHFYLRRTGLGVLYALFSWSGIPTLLGVIEASFMPGRVRKYNDTMATGSPQRAFAVGSPCKQSGSGKLLAGVAILLALGFILCNMVFFALRSHFWPRYVVEVDPWKFVTYTNRTGGYSLCYDPTHFKRITSSPQATTQLFVATHGGAEFSVSVKQLTEPVDVTVGSEAASIHGSGELSRDRTSFEVNSNSAQRVIRGRGLFREKHSYVVLDTRYEPDRADYSAEFHRVIGCFKLTRSPGSAARRIQSVGQ